MPCNWISLYYCSIQLKSLLVCLIRRNVASFTCFEIKQDHHLTVEDAVHSWEQNLAAFKELVNNIDGDDDKIYILAIQLIIMRSISLTALVLFVVFVAGQIRTLCDDYDNIITCYQMMTVIKMIMIITKIVIVVVTAATAVATVAVAVVAAAAKFVGK